MKSVPIRTAHIAHRLDFIGDHLAIDFINTSRRVGDQVRDTLQSDEDVRIWLGLAGVTVPAAPADGTLLAAARKLRDIALCLVEKRKAGKRPNLGDLNAFLEGALSHTVVRRAGGVLEVERVFDGTSSEGYLGVVAEAVADLVVNADFERIRPCAGERCVLWFYDRTKAHGRRFCSAAGCGNRAKVAAFRARLRDGI